MIKRTLVAREARNMEAFGSEKERHQCGHGEQNEKLLHDQ